MSHTQCFSLRILWCSWRDNYQGNNLTNFGYKSDNEKLIKKPKSLYCWLPTRTLSSIPNQQFGKKKFFEILQILSMKNAIVYVKIVVLIAKYLLKYLKWFYINRQLVAFCGKVSLCNGFFHLCHYYYYYYKRLYIGQCINIRRPINFNPQSSISSTMIFLVANFVE
jgi:hypothetical protein